MKINPGHARVRLPKGSPVKRKVASGLLCFHSVDHLQVMPSADKRPPIPVLRLDSQLYEQQEIDHYYGRGSITHSVSGRHDF